MEDTKNPSRLREGLSVLGHQPRITLYPCDIADDNNYFSIKKLENGNLMIRLSNVSDNLIEMLDRNETINYNIKKLLGCVVHRERYEYKHFL